MITLELEAEVTQDLMNIVTSRFEAQLNVVLIAALARAIQGLTGSPRTLINIEGHGREDIKAHVNVARTVGWFTSYYPLLVEIEPDLGAAELVPEVASQVQHVPTRGIGYLLLRHLGDEAVRRHLAAQPHAEIGFNFMGQQRDSGRAGAPADAQGSKTVESMGPTQSRMGVRPHLLDVSGVVRQGRLQMRWAYSANLHRQETIEKLAETFFDILRQVASAVRQMP